MTDAQRDPWLGQGDIRFWGLYRLGVMLYIIGQNAGTGLNQMVGPVESYCQHTGRVTCKGSNAVYRVVGPAGAPPRVKSWIRNTHKNADNVTHRLADITLWADDAIPY